MLPIKSCVNSSVWEGREAGGLAPGRLGESFPLPLEMTGESLLDLLMVTF